MEVTMKSTTLNILKNCQTALVLTFSLGFMLFIYAPLEIYFNNQSSFWYDMYMLVPPMALVTLASIIGGFLLIIVFYVTTPKLYHALTIALFIVYICTYIQGNFLVSCLPRLDGTPIAWENFDSERLKCIILWISVTTGSLLIIKKAGISKFLTLSKYIAIFITLMLSFTLITLCFTTEGYKNKSTLCTSDKNLFTYSEDTNFVIFLLDSMDSRNVKLMLNDQNSNHEYYNTIFEDFTYYDNMMGGYPFTLFSVPLLLSGQWYEYNMPIDDFFYNTYMNAPLFQTLSKEGYQLDIYYESLTPYTEDYFRFSNVLPSAESSLFHPTFAVLNIKLVGLKYAPFDLKKYCTLDNGDFDSAIFLQFRQPIENHKAFTPYNDVFYNNILNAQIETINNKCFKYIHIEGAHNPFQYNKNVERIQNGTYQDNLEACMTIINAYLTKLKENDVYDNSIIIIMADHGFDSSAGDDILNSYFYRQNPVFFVKGINEHHPLQISSAPVSFSDLGDAYTKLINASKGDTIFPYQETDMRKRRWLYYDGGEYMTEYYQYRNAWDIDSLKESGITYPKIN